MDKAPFPEPIKRLIFRFYELIDSLDPESDRELATQIFASDGKFIVNTTELSGSEGRRLLIRYQDVTPFIRIGLYSQLIESLRRDWAEAAI